MKLNWPMSVAAAAEPPAGSASPTLSGATRITTRSYSRDEILQLCRKDVILPRPLRKTIFGLQLWQPKLTRVNPADCLQSVSSAGDTSRALDAETGRRIRPCVTAGRVAAVVPVVTPCSRRHQVPAGRQLTFASLNVRSLSPLKLDTLLLEVRDRQLDVLILCETWHDADSVSICRLRS